MKAVGLQGQELWPSGKGYIRELRAKLLGPSRPKLKKCKNTKLRLDELYLVLKDGLHRLIIVIVMDGCNLFSGLDVTF